MIQKFYLWIYSSKYWKQNLKRSAFIYPYVYIFIHLLGSFYIPGIVLSVKWALLNIEKDMIPAFLEFSLEGEIEIKWI